MSPEACDACLRRSFLVGMLGPRIEGRLQGPNRKIAGVLALSEPELLAALAPDQADEVSANLDLLDLDKARAAAAAAGVAVVCRHDVRYPATLGEFGDAPACLWLRGEPELLDAVAEAESVTVVGSRAASAYGIEVGHELSRGLAAAGLSVVSGLAMGIDAAAHRGALAAHGRTVAVLGCGVDVVYPRTNRRLYEQIVERGLIVSELPPGRRPFRWSFPARNRIMAALADMTVVVEAADPSGSLITSAFAADLGRPVGAVPGLVTDRHAQGTNRLLRDGAIVIRDARDVLDELFGAGERDARPEPRLEPPLDAVLAHVGSGAGVDEIASRTGLSGAEARAALGRLELLGLVSRTGVGAYTRAPCIL